MTSFLPKHAPGRGVVIICFGLWGGLGLGVSFIALLSAPILTAIYVALMWIGGTVLFGLATLMSTPTYRLVDHGLPVYVVAKPAEDGLNYEYRGIRYAKFEDGKILAEFGDGNHTFKSWKKFVEAIPDEE